MRRLLLGAACFALLAGSLKAQAPDAVWTAPFGPGGTWNLYEVYLTTDSWVNAHNRTFTGSDSLGLGVKGHLVSLHSTAENNWVHGVAGGGDVWIGLTDRVGEMGQDIAGNPIALGATESQGTADNRTMGWKWTSGEAFSYQNWSQGEPNDFNGAEDAAHLGGNTLWNDNSGGWAANQPVADTTNGEEEIGFGRRFKYVIEYDAGLDDPQVLVDLGAQRAVGSVPATMLNCGGPFQAGQWNICEVTGAGQVNDVTQAYNILAGSGGTRVSGTASTLNHNDPQTNGAGAGFVVPDQPFLTNTGADDEDISMVARAQIVADMSGRYTFGTHSDDGFWLRLRRPNGTLVNWESSNGAGGIDPLDPTLLRFPGPTGDSNTRGIIELEQGVVYDIEYGAFERAGGAFWELYAAKGEFTADSDAMLLVGAGDRPVQVLDRKIRLAGPASVATVNGNRRGAAPEFTEPDGVRSKVLNAIGAGTAFVREDVTRMSISDPQTNAGSFAYPNNTPADDQDFITGVFGNIEVTPGNGGNYVFHLTADDGLEMRVVGQDFAAVTDFTGDGDAALRDIDSDMACSADYYTGNTNTNCLINLAEGTYSFEAFNYEGGGGAFMQVWYTMADDVNTPFNAATWTLLDTGIIPAADSNLSLVPEPSTYALAAMAVLGGLFVRRRRK
jgi:hypothetical protein